MTGRDIEGLAFFGVSALAIDWLDNANRLPVRWWFVLVLLAVVLAYRHAR